MYLDSKHLTWFQRLEFGRFNDHRSSDLSNFGTYNVCILFWIKLACAKISNFQQNFNSHEAPGVIAARDSTVENHTEHSWTMTLPLSPSLTHTHTHPSPASPPSATVSVIQIILIHISSFTVLFQLNLLFTACFKNVTVRRSLIRAYFLLAHTRHHMHTHTHTHADTLIQTQTQETNTLTHIETQKLCMNLENMVFQSGRVQDKWEVKRKKETNGERERERGRERESAHWTSCKTQSKVKFYLAWNRQCQVADYLGTVGHQTRRKKQTKYWMNDHSSAIETGGQR